MLAHNNNNNKNPFNLRTLWIFTFLILEIFQSGSGFMIERTLNRVQKIHLIEVYFFQDVHLLNLEKKKKKSN